MTEPSELSLTAGRDGRRSRLGSRLEVVPLRIWGSELAAWRLVGPEHPEADVEAVEVRDPGDPHVDLLPEVRQASARRALARGDRGFFLLVGDVVAGWWWATTVTHRDRWSGVKIRLQPGDVYTYDMWFERDQRGAGRSLVLADQVKLSLAADPAVHRVFALFELDNRATMHLVQLGGWQPVQALTVVRVNGRIGWHVPWSCRPRRGPASRRPLPSGWAP